VEMRSHACCIDKRSLLQGHAYQLHLVSKPIGPVNLTAGTCKTCLTASTTNW
jgi:hypothetical protein